MYHFLMAISWGILGAWWFWQNQLDLGIIAIGIGTLWFEINKK